MYPFNVRVYGLLIEGNKILVTHENIKGYEMTKFPGGGLEFGEGLIDCLKREFNEELNIEIEVLGHFYTTDFFQKSAFNSNEQIISIYYKVKRKSLNSISVSEEEIVNHFEWLDITSFETNRLTFPIDRLVIKKLKENYIA